MPLNILEPEKEKKSIAFKALGISIILTTTIAVALLIISFLSYKQIAEIRIKNWQRKVSQLENESEKLKELEEKIVAFQNQLEKFKDLIADIPYHSYFLSSFERALLKETSINTLKIELLKDKKIEVTGIAKNLTNIAFLLTSLKEAPLYNSQGDPFLIGDEEVKIFEKVELNSADLDIVSGRIGYQFTITLTLSSQAFEKLTKEKEISPKSFPQPSPEPSPQNQETQENTESPPLLE